MRFRAPAYRGPVLHFDGLRFVALREGGRNEETLATENERKILYAYLRTYTQPTWLFAAGAHLAARSPGLLCGLASWPLLGILLHLPRAWRLLHVSRKVIFVSTFFWPLAW